jgi:hypothetical protein
MKYRTYILTREENEIIETHNSTKELFDYLKNSLYSSTDFSLCVQTYFLNLDGHFMTYDNKFNFDNR